MRGNALSIARKGGYPASDGRLFSPFRSFVFAASVRSRRARRPRRFITRPGRVRCVAFITGRWTMPRGRRPRQHANVWPAPISYRCRRVMNALADETVGQSFYRAESGRREFSRDRSIAGPVSPPPDAGQ